MRGYTKQILYNGRCLMNDGVYVLVGNSQVEWKSKGSADGWDTQNDVGTINGATVPCLGSKKDSRNPYRQGSPVLSRNGYCLIGILKESLNTNRLMVAFCSCAES